LPPDVIFYSQNAPNSISAGALPIPHWGAYSAPPDLLAAFKGPTSKGREERNGGREEQGRGEGRGEDLLLRRGEGKGGKVAAWR